MKRNFTVRAFGTLILASSGMLAAALVHAGPQVTFYLTLPLGGPSAGHVFGLRLDRESALPTMRNMNPSSPLNRRALLDLDRRLTWDINRLQWYESSKPATFTLRVPLREPASKADARAAQSASLLHPFQDQARKIFMKSFAVEP
jgi:hypothetical protein